MVLAHSQPARGKIRVEYAQTIYRAILLVAACIKISVRSGGRVSLKHRFTTSALLCPIHIV